MIINKFGEGGAAGIRVPTAPAYQVVQHTDAPLAEVAVQGKKFNWIRPICRCGRKVWGHGFVLRCFAGLAEAVWLKRFRCAGCSRVFTMIPAGFTRRYQSPVAVVWAALRFRLTHYLWPKGLPRQRGGHWLCKFLAMCKMDFPSEKNLVAVLEQVGARTIYFG